MLDKSIIGCPGTPWSIGVICLENRYIDKRKNRSFIWNDVFLDQPYRKVGKVENGGKPWLKRKIQPNLFTIQDLIPFAVINQNLNRAYSERGCRHFPQVGGAAHLAPVVRQ